MLHPNESVIIDKHPANQYLSQGDTHAELKIKQIIKKQWVSIWSKWWVKKKGVNVVHTAVTLTQTSAKKCTMVLLQFAKEIGVL